MVSWFRRSGSETAPAKSTPVRRSTVPAKAGTRPASARTPTAFPDSVVVTEGNEASDWALWEDSMTALDSQMQGLQPSDRVQVRESRPSQPDEVDAWSTVGKNRDV